MKKYLLLVGLLAVSQSAFATEELMKNYRGIRSLGMGGIVTSTGLYDEALFGNPATQMEDPNWKLTILGVTVEANTHIIKDASAVNDVKNTSGGAAISQIADRGLAGRNEHTRLTMIMPGFYSPKFFGENTGFAVALLYNAQANIMLRGNAEVDTQSYVDVGPAFGFGQKLLNGDLDLGVNVRLLYRLAADKSLRAFDFLGGSKLSLSSVGGQGIGIDGDFGAYYKLPVLRDGKVIKTLSVGTSLNNLAKSTYRIAGKEIIKSVKTSPLGNDRTLNLGVRADFQDFFCFHESLFAVEFQNVGTTNRLASFWKKMHLGGETKLTKIVALRAGFNQGYLGGGVGLDFPVAKVDLATYGEEMGANVGRIEDRRFVFRLSFDI